MTKDELGINIIESHSNKEVWSANREEVRRDISTDLTAKNFAAERSFKMTVLDWLNNGEPKIFRSPGEGNYLVRLMNVSLSPNTQLGNMLHTFSCTAYEVGEYNLENLSYFSIFDPIESTK
jgi:hypothetical protein